jgi:short-subunit dehydrogenase
MNIVITGASKGIGFELSKLFAQDEENTVIGIARNENLLKELRNECIKQNLKTKFKPLVFNLEDLNAVKSNLKEEIKQHISSIDILINNAGFLVNKPFIETKIDDFTKTFTINFFSPSLIIQELIPMIKESNIKHVVNISSMGGFQGSSKFPGLSFYSASKAALASLTECLAEEYKGDEIKFNCLALGAVNTDMLKSAFPGYNAPLESNEMAQYIYNFAINNHKFMNGKVIPVSLSTP